MSLPQFFFDVEGLTEMLSEVKWSQEEDFKYPPCVVVDRPFDGPEKTMRDSIRKALNQSSMQGGDEIIAATIAWAEDSEHPTLFADMVGGEVKAFPMEIGDEGRRARYTASYDGSAPVSGEVKLDGGNPLQAVREHVAERASSLEGYPNDPSYIKIKSFEVVE